MTSLWTSLALRGGMSGLEGVARAAWSSSMGPGVVPAAASLVLAGRGMSTGVVRGLNILKSGHDPEEMKDDDVPDWLRDLGKNGAGQTLQELERKGELTGPEARQLAKLRNRQSIKRANALSAK